MRNNKLTKQFVTFLAVIAVCLSMIPTTSIHAVDVDLNTLKLRCLASMSKKSYSGNMYLYNTDGTKVTTKKNMKLCGVGYYINGKGKKKNVPHTFGPETGTGLCIVVPAPHGYNFIAGNVKFYVTDMNTPIKTINLNP